MVDVDSTVKANDSNYSNDKNKSTSIYRIKKRCFSEYFLSTTFFKSKKYS